MYELKYELINNIIKHKKYKYYLELGLGPNVETYSVVECENKYSVDILKINDQLPSFLGSTDDFFLQNKVKYDLIYIDADHSYDAVNKDFLNAVKCLNEDGIICMHDVGPLRECDTIPTAAGEAYKSFIDIRKNIIYDAFCYEFSNTDILGLVKIRKNTDLLNVGQDCIVDFNYYDKNRETILRKKHLNDLIRYI